MLLRNKPVVNGSSAVCAAEVAVVPCTAISACYQVGPEVSAPFKGTVGMDHMTALQFRRDFPFPRGCKSGYALLMKTTNMPGNALTSETGCIRV